MKPRKPLKRSTVPLRRSRVKRANPKRKAREFARAYGSKERVEFVKSLPCVVENGLFHLGFSENVHVVGGGAGRKAGAQWIVPMCEGHHRKLHEMGRRTFEKHFDIHLDAEAERTEKSWRAHHAGEP